MGIFNKLKNALFEEEEIEIDSTPEKVVIKDEEPIIKKEETPIKKEVPLENERELFKTENTFNFPDFDEEEFVTNYEPPFAAPVEKETRVTRKSEPERERPKSNNLYAGSAPKIKTTSEKNQTRRRKEKSSQKSEPAKKSFTPSPIISPVYGVLDKNYKKEDIITAAKKDIIKDVDMARKKAFGKLEEEIEPTFEDPLKDFYNDDSKSIDELLSESIDDTIDIKYDEPEEITVDEYQDTVFTNDLEEELNNIEDDFESFPEEPESTKEEPKKENSLDDTLESDLFDLIDSMYDDREEE